MKIAGDQFQRLSKRLPLLSVGEHATMGGVAVTCGDKRLLVPQLHTLRGRSKHGSQEEIHLTVAYKETACTTST